MKKYLIVILICLFTCNLINGQIGIKAGLHTFDLDTPTDIIFPSESSISFSEAKLGFQGGIYGKIKLGGVFLEPRLMLNSTKVEYRLDGENGTFGDQLLSERFTNLDIPLLLGVEVLFLDLTLGPVAHIHLNSISDLVDFSEYDSQFSRAEYGWRAGVGTSIGNMSIGVEYEGNFSDFGDHITIANQEFSFGTQPSRLIFNVGVDLW